MKILVDGEFYEYDFNNLDMAEAMEMEERTGHGLLSMELAWNQMKPSAFKWIAYAARKRAGKVDLWETFTFDLAALVSDLYPPEVAEPEADAPDPTRLTSPESESPPDEPSTVAPASMT